MKRESDKEKGGRECLGEYVVVSGEGRGMAVLGTRHWLGEKTLISLLDIGTPAEDGSAEGGRGGQWLVREGHKWRGR